MTNHVELKVYSTEELIRRWSAHAWKDTPSVMIALPFPGGVLFGAKGRAGAHRVSFFLDPEDALAFGQKLIDAAKQARAK